MKKTLIITLLLSMTTVFSFSQNRMSVYEIAKKALTASFPSSCHPADISKVEECSILAATPEYTIYRVVVYGNSECGYYTYVCTITAYNNGTFEYKDQFYFPTS